MRINTNLNAMVAYRNLSNVNSWVSDSTSKLSTGFRINRAADDAAGLGIANKLRAENRALGQASRNAEQANSVLQIAEGATSNVQKMLERMKELATQAGSDSVDAEGRARINSEFTKLRDEITRTVDTTVFQGNTLLNGEFGAVGAQLEAADVVQANAVAAPGSYSLSVDESGKSVTLTLAGGASQTLDLDVTADGAKITYDSTAKKTSFNFDALGFTIKADTIARDDFSSVKTELNGKKFDYATSFDATTSTLDNATSVSATTLDAGLKAGLYTITAAADGAGTGVDLKLMQGTTQIGSTVNIAAADLDDAKTVDFGGTSLQFEYAAVASRNQATVISDLNNKTVDVDGTSTVSNNPTEKQANFLVGSSGRYRSDDIISLKALDLRTTTLGIDLSNLSTATDARNALTAIDSAIGKVNQSLGDIGANQNRLENTMSNLKTTILNFTAAESVIRDLDMAEEMMKFSKNNILSQAATAMLAQANQSQQGVLQLLRG